MIVMRLFLCLLLFIVETGAPAPVSGQTSSERAQFRDSRGYVIPSNPANRAFKLVSGVPEYIIGRGDLLEITTFQARIRTTELARVFPDGTVFFSVLNSVLAAGMTPSELSRFLTQALSRYVRNPRVQVFVKEYLSKHVVVFGAVNRSGASLAGTHTGPGVYPLKGCITAFEQILQAGGPTIDARLDAVLFIRNNRTYMIDLQGVFRGDDRQNVVLEHGDILQVTGIPTGIRERSSIRASR